MSTRQERLDAKIEPLTRAMIWSRRLARLLIGLCALGLIVLIADAVGMLAADGAVKNQAALEQVADGLAEIVFGLFIAWWVQRISDGCSAMVDVIGELSETV